MRYKDPNNVSKQKILLESFKLFATKPFSDITFTDIEKVTGLSRGAILYHFKSKDEILASIIDRFIINKEYDLPTIDRKSTRLNSSHRSLSRMPSSA